MDQPKTMFKTFRFFNFIISLVFLFFITSGVYSQKANGAKPENSEKKSGVKKFEEVITKDAVADTGMFNTYKLEDKYFFEIADSLLEREILVVSRISGTVENFNFGGAGMKARNQQVWRWQKKDNNIVLRSVSYNSVASEDEPIYQSVRNNNFEPVVMVFDIKAFNKDSSASVIQVDELFTTDVPMIGPLSQDQRKNFGVRSLDKKRSMISWMKSFPMNTEIRHILTFDASQLPSNQNTNTLSIEMNQSLVLLPEKPMMPRMYDRRVGYFSISQIDYGLDEQKATERQYITRYRLEPKDVEAFKRGELVEPVKQIVYYIDPATPVKWRKFIKQGVEDWQEAFEAAGFKNAIIAKDPPTKEEDPDWSPEDVRYSVIRYTANPIQNAMGPHVHDPRSGEILEADVIWYHNVMNLLRNWFFIQTAAVNEEAQKVKFEDEVMGKLIRFVSAHEVGHTLGFPHNMGASNSYPVDSLRSAKFTNENGICPSIMDYARFNYVAQPGDSAFLFPKIGPYDKWVVKWGYSPLPGAKTPDEEKTILNGWVRERENDPVFWYGGQQGELVDPRAQTEDIGSDAMDASSYGIKNLERIINNLIAWTQEPGKDYDDLQELYDQVLIQWNRYNGHVRANIGGVYETDKTYDQVGVVYEYVPEALQKKAMSWINTNTFSTPAWALNQEIIRRIDGTGTVEKIRRYQVSTLNNLLEPNKIGRLIEGEAMEGNKAYTPLEMFDDLRTGIWSEIKKGSTIDIYRRNLQRAYLDRMEFLMTDQKADESARQARSSRGTQIDVAQSDIRPLVRAQLKTLLAEIKTAILKTKEKASKYHLEDSVERIKNILEPNK